MYSEQTQIDYRRIEKAISYIQEHHRKQPTLEEIAEHIHLSPYHFQRLFTKWAGISPKKFLQYLTIQYARECLNNNLSLAQIAHEAGLSGTGRLHDLFISIDGMTPDQYRRSGSGLTIYYGFHHSPFGKYLLAITLENRICTLQFVEDENLAIEELTADWKESNLFPDRDRTEKIASRIFNPVLTEPIKLLARGSPFQLKVWEAMLKIPFGEMISYQSIAEYIDMPKGLQAVGSAIGKNPVAYLIPCHRVIKKTGQISEYRWGRIRKTAILAWEAIPEKHPQSI